MPLARSIALLAGMFASLATVGPAAAQAEPLGLLTGLETQVIVKFDGGTSTRQRLELLKQIDGIVRHLLPLDDVMLIDVPGSRTQAMSWLEDRPEVQWAEPNDRVHAQAGVNYAQGDPFFTKQWGLENYGNDERLYDADIDALASWDATKAVGETVGVVDSGVDASHPDLAGQLVPGVNFVPDGHASTADGSGHGTNVTGIIAAVENSIGIVGAAPGVKVEPLRALGDDGAGTSATIASAFSFAGKEGLRVVNASLGAASPSKAVAEAIASSPNTLFVVTAGNGGVDLDRGGANYPCQFDLPNILCVGATDGRDARASFSNRGTLSVDLSAPGVSIFTTAPGGSYVFENGTSVAAPFAAAVAAQVAALHPDWSPAQIREQLVETVDQPDSLQGANATGGRVNAARAVGLYAGPDGHKPERVTGLTGVGGVEQATLTWDTDVSIDVAKYQVEILQGSSWWLRASMSGELTTATITELPAGVSVTFRVRAVDRSGEASDPSDPVTVLPTAPPVAAAPSTGAGSPAPTTGSGSSSSTPVSNPGSGSTGTTKTGAGVPTGPTSTGSTISGPGTDAIGTTLAAVRRVTVRGRVRGLSFTLSSACKVTVTAVPLAKQPGRTTVTKRFSLRAGSRKITFGRGAAAFALPRGRWRVTLATASNQISLKLAVR